MKKMNKEVLKNTSALEIVAMYNSTKEWISTIEFYIDDLHGLRNILDRYLDEILQHENLDEIRECAMQLQDLRYKCNSLLEEVKSHSIKLVESQEKEVLAPFLVKEHLEFKKRLVIFQKEFKEIKKEIYTITEHAIEIDKEEKLAVKLEKIKTARNR